MRTFALVYCAPLFVAFVLIGWGIFSVFGLDYWGMQPPGWIWNHIERIVPVIVFMLVVLALSGSWLWICLKKQWLKS